MRAQKGGMVSRQKEPVIFPNSENKLVIVLPFTTCSNKIKRKQWNCVTGLGDLNEFANRSGLQ